jgi:two-component system LytT family response regulator
MIRACIIDDEENSRLALRKLLNKYCTSVEIVSEDGDIDAAFASIVQHKPHLLFLDVAMPGGSGFDLLKKFTLIDFEVVFVTAYDHYALQAIRISALDYLLKPLNIDDLRNTITRVQGKVSRSNAAEQIRVLLDNLVTRNPSSSRIALPSQKGFEFVDMNEIIRIEADGSYTRVVLTNGRKILTTQHLNEYERMLPDAVFFRSHHSYIVNLAHISRYVKGDGGQVVMSDMATIDVARRKKKEFLDRFHLG